MGGTYGGSLQKILTFLQNMVVSYRTWWFPTEHGGFLQNTPLQSTRDASLRTYARCSLIKTFTHVNIRRSSTCPDRTFWKIPESPKKSPEVPPKTPQKSPEKIPRSPQKIPKSPQKKSPEVPRKSPKVPRQNPQKSPKKPPEKCLSK